MKKRLIIIAAAMAVFAGIAVAVYAAYDVTGSSSPEGFASGTAANLVPNPDEGDLTGILPGQTKPMDVVVTNTNPVGVTVTGVSATFSGPDGTCALTATPWAGVFGLAGGASDTWTLSVTMGTPGPSCEGATVNVTATAAGTMP